MPAPATSTGFAGLQDYLNANQPAVDSTATGLVNSDANAANAAKAQSQAVQGEGFTAGMSNSGPVDPTTLAGYGAAQKANADATQNLDGLSTFGGLSQQLQSQYGQGYETPQTIGASGDRNLDANLLQSDPGAQSQFKAAQAQYGGLDAYLDQKANSGIAQGQGAHTAEGQGTAPTGLEPSQATPIEPKWNTGTGGARKNRAGGDGGGDGYGDSDGTSAPYHKNQYTNPNPQSTDWIGHGM